MDFRSLFIDKDKIVMANMELGVALNSLDEAIVLNQLNYWIERNKDANRNFHDGYYWAYNSYEAWKKQDFPVWSATKIKRIFTSLEGKGIVLSANYNKLAIDKTKWYTIDYKKLKDFIEEYTKGQNETQSDQNEKSKGHNDQPIDQNDQTLDQSEIPIPDTNNRDYSTDNTNRDLPTEKGENINKVNGEVKTCSLQKKSMDAPKTRLEKYRSMKSEEVNMIEQVRNICDSILENEEADEVYNTLEHYFKRYTEKTGKIHPILTTQTRIDIIDKISTYSDTEYCHFERVINDEGMFIKIVDAFFDGDFGQVTGHKTNWNLPHFMSDGVLDRLAQRVFMAEEV